MNISNQKKMKQFKSRVFTVVNTVPYLWQGCIVISNNQRILSSLNSLLDPYTSNPVTGAAPSRAPIISRRPHGTCGVKGRLGFRTTSSVLATPTVVLPFRHSLLTHQLHSALVVSRFFESLPYLLDD